MPTIIEVTGIERPGRNHKGRKIEPLTGKSLLPLTLGQTNRIHGEDEPIGYELLGNKALYKGDYKIVLNRGPVGDNSWHLYMAALSSLPRNLADELVRLESGNERLAEERKSEREKVLDNIHGLLVRASKMSRNITMMNCDDPLIMRFPHLWPARCYVDLAVGSARDLAAEGEHEKALERYLDGFAMIKGALQ